MDILDIQDKFTIILGQIGVHIIIFTPRAESPEGYYYHDCGRAAGRECAMSVVTHFFHSIFELRS